MIRIGGRVVAWTAAAFAVHLMSVSTPLGMVRFELPFFIAYIYAAGGARPWPACLMVFVPSLCFDVLDNQFAGTLSVLIVFVLIRRLKLFVDFVRVPSCFALGLIMAVADRLTYGLLVGLPLGSGAELALKAVLDPGFALTVLFLPLGFLRGRP